MTRSVLVTGATGQQGGAVARALRGRAHRVRALTRRPDSAPARELDQLGIELAQGDFDDRDSLRQALKGVDAVFVMGTPFEVDAATETRQGIAVLDAASEAGVDQVVYSSVASADDDTGIPHFESKAAVERHLNGLGPRHTVIAPAGFLENLTAPWTLPGLRDGAYVFALPPDRPLQQVAVADVGAFAALVLSEPDRFDGQRIEIASSENTGPEVAAVLTRSLGRTIQYEELSMEAVRAGGDADYVRMIEFFRGRGYTVDIEALHTAYPEIGWHSLDTWAAAVDWERLLAS
jgi:uncharacterized protein YbjT (DUF2867 family)